MREPLWSLLFSSVILYIKMHYIWRSTCRLWVGGMPPDMSDLPYGCCSGSQAPAWEHVLLKLCFLFEAELHGVVPKQSLGTSPTPSHPTASAPDSAAPDQTAAPSPATPQRYAEDCPELSRKLLAETTYFFYNRIINHLFLLPTQVSDQSNDR